MDNRFEEFTASVTRINRCINKIKSNEMITLGLKGSHTMCIYNLSKNDQGLTNAQLSEVCEEDKAAISRTINYLKTNGYVEQLGENNYRAKIILTDKGKETAKKINKAVESALNIIGLDFKGDEREQFYNTLNNIATKLSKFCQNN